MGTAPHTIRARDARAAGDYAAGNLQAGNIGSTRRRRVSALALHHIGSVDAGGGDVDQHLAMARLGRRPARRDQGIRPPRLGYFDSQHVTGYPLSRFVHLFPLPEIFRELL